MAKYYTIVWGRSNIAIVDMNTPWIKPLGTNSIIDNYINVKTTKHDTGGPKTWNKAYTIIPFSEFCAKHNITLDDVLKAVK